MKTHHVEFETNHTKHLDNYAIRGSAIKGLLIAICWDNGLDINYIPGSHPHLNINGTLAKPPLNLWHVWLIASHRTPWNLLNIHKPDTGLAHLCK